jgi:hypothetical protein
VLVLFIHENTRRDRRGLTATATATAMFADFLTCLALLTTSQLGVASAHGVHTNFDQLALESDADWATRHMISEHHIMNFDPNAFFKLHDL